jgi:hypothetical protein
MCNVFAPPASHSVALATNTAMTLFMCLGIIIYESGGIYLGFERMAKIFQLEQAA